MSSKVTQEATKALLVRKMPLVLHWKLEKWADAKGLGKEEAAEIVLKRALKHVKLED